MSSRHLLAGPKVLLGLPFAGCAPLLPPRTLNLGSRGHFLLPRLRHEPRDDTFPTVIPAFIAGIQLSAGEAAVLLCFTLASATAEPWIPRTLVCRASGTSPGMTCCRGSECNIRQTLYRRPGTGHGMTHSLPSSRHLLPGSNSRLGRPLCCCASPLRRRRLSLGSREHLFAAPPARVPG
ncbi:hypothetical protein SAMN04488061_3035 [Filomicrobium insigne]|uniref:Uncharacterized protein n=1 Tax=Filomicrobium insigne TaxID=418854 RepID=A0A1H0STR7_9HYPH|nr:hypothetical protein SAMN04488061_3035 [Filomicrobium insigne]